MPDRVCVSGVTGLVGAQIAADLLAAGYIVHGTARNVSDPARLAHLTSLPGAAERFVAFEADLLTAGAFADAQQGCAYAIHCASPYFMDPKGDAQGALVDPAVEGALSFLRSAAATAGLKRVVLTSSVAAIADGGAGGKVFSEDDWNERSSLARLPYYYSKVCSERAAWKFMADEAPRFDLVVVNPFMVVGPSLVPGLNASHGLIKKMADGEFPGVVDFTFVFVDVRDVSKAHVRAMTDARAAGRYVCAAAPPVHMRAIVDALAAKGLRPPARDLTSRFVTAAMRFVSRFSDAPDMVYTHNNIGNPILVANDKIVRDLAMSFRDPLDTLRDTIDDMLAHGHLKLPPA